MRHALLFAALATAAALSARAADLPIFDAHVHYSHDAWENVPPKDAIALMRKAGVRRALVSSSDDDGNVKLFAEAPDLVLPSLRPYRRRADVSTWTRDDGVARYVEERIRRASAGTGLPRGFRYYAIGEFHLFGADADLPVPRRMVALAKQHRLLLHAHSDIDAIERIFKQDPDARVLWAHSGFERPERVAELLRKHQNLWADLAFRSDHGAGGKVQPEWRELFLALPDRFTVGSDTYVPERWPFIVEHAAWSRQWLAGLPANVAENIAWRNGERLIEAIRKWSGEP